MSSQNIEKIEGEFNLSEFEIAASLYLLDNQQFIYSAMFGSVDLIFYGDYLLKDGVLIIIPFEEQKQPFTIYARKNDSLKDATKVRYYEYTADHDPLFNINNQWLKVQGNEEPLTFILPTSEITSFKIGYPTYHDESDDGDGSIYVEGIVNIGVEGIANGENDFIIAHNMYYQMVKRFGNNQLRIEDDTLLMDGKSFKKRRLTNKKDILQYIEENKAFPSTITNDEDVYQKVKLNTEHQENQELKIEQKDYSIIESEKK